MGKRKWNIFGAAVLAVFFMFTLTVRFIDVEAVGAAGSSVGFSTINQSVHEFFGVHMPLYTVTDRLSIVPVGVMLGFTILGLAQWIGRKSLFRVDADILALGGFYIVVMGVYLLFEAFAVNYRPVLINGQLEASYPSSTTVLVLCVMLTAEIQIRARIKKKWLRRAISFFSIAFAAFMVIGRLLSGVHWITDIVGGVLLSAGLVLMYRAVSANAA